MTKHILPIFLAAISVFMLASCLGSDDDETVYYDDTAITAFTLGTLNVSHLTKASDGITDSTYTTTLTGSDYHFSIDQLARTIYNTDSLPYGTDAAHVLVTISSKNSGTVILNLRNQSGADSLAYYSSSDSIDFTNPVRVRVYNMRGTAYREYTAQVNVHKEKADSFQWKATIIDGLENVDGKRFINLSNGNLVLVGTQDGAAVAYQKTASGWEKANSLVIPAYTPSYTANTCYAFMDGKIMKSTDNAATWVEDSIDDSAGNLPSSDACIIARPSPLGDGSYNLALIGNRDSRTVVWSKVEEKDNTSNPWTYYPADEYNTKTLPHLYNMRAIAYNDGILATGGDFTKMYYSQDNALTWATDTTYTLPGAFGLEATPFAFGVDAGNTMYISKDGSNEIWSGRLAKLGWKKEDNIFMK